MKYAILETNQAARCIFKGSQEPERVSPVADAQQVSDDHRVNQKRKENEERITECTRHIDNSGVSYQSLIDDIHQSKIVFKTVEDVIASVRVAIAKV